MDKEIEALKAELIDLKAALVQSDLDYQNLSEKYGELLEQKRCGCERMEGVSDDD